MASVHSFVSKTQRNTQDRDEQNIVQMTTDIIDQQDSSRNSGSMRRIKLSRSGEALGRRIEFELVHVEPRQPFPADDKRGALIMKDIHQGFASPGPLRIELIDDHDHVSLMEEKVALDANRASRGQAKAAIVLEEIPEDSAHSDAIAALGIEKANAKGQSGGTHNAKQIASRANIFFNKHLVAEKPVVLAPIPGKNAPAGYVALSQGPSLTALLREGWSAFGIASLVALVLAGSMGVLVSRAISRPLTSLAGAASKMQAGDLSARAPVDAMDEIGRTAESFNAMAEQLEASFQALSADRDALRNFVADASHELRTPITALSNFMTLLDGQDLEAGQRQEFVEESRRQVARLEWVTANLLDLSRLDAGIIDLDLESCEAEELLSSIVESLLPRATEKQKRLGLRCDASIDNSRVRVDRGRIGLAVGNLIENAIKYSADEELIQVEVFRGAQAGTEAGPNADEEESQAAKSPPASGPSDEWLKIRVSDKGPGIAPDEAARIFERFYRGRAGEALDALEKDGAGNGLGLPIAQAIARAHGGELDLVPSDTGATFEIRLPISKDI